MSRLNPPAPRQVPNPDALDVPPLLERLAAQAETVRVREERLRDAITTRDQLVIEAKAAGETNAAVAVAAGITKGRVSQIVAVA